MTIGVASGESGIRMISAASEIYPPLKIEHYGFDTFQEEPPEGEKQ